MVQRPFTAEEVERIEAMHLPIPQREFAPEYVEHIITAVRCAALRAAQREADGERENVRGGVGRVRRGGA
jgi:hypothetical protein